MFLKSRFDRSTIKFLLNLCETEIDFTTEILRKYSNSDFFLTLLQNISDYLFSENENDSHALDDIIRYYRKDTRLSDTPKNEKIEHPALSITNFIDYLRVV